VTLTREVSNSGRPNARLHFRAEMYELILRAAKGGMPHGYVSLHGDFNRRGTRSDTL